MTITITLTADAATGAGVDFNAGYASYFSGFTPYGMPWFLGPTASDTTQIVHLDTPTAGNEAATRAVLLEGEDFEYTFSDHTVSGSIDTVRLTRLGSAYDPVTGDFVLEGGVVTAATDYITFSGLTLSNAPHVRGDVHTLVAGLMGGGPDGTSADPSVLTDTIWAQGHNLLGSTGGDTYTGSRYADVIRGFGGHDRLAGGAGNDRILGSAGHDTLTGGAGADILDGGPGADDFVYLTASDSTVTSRDRIVNFASGVDDIDLRQMDADTRDADRDSFVWRGTGAFNGQAGALNWRTVAAGVLVQADLDGDRVADFSVVLTGIDSLLRADFLL